MSVVTVVTRIFPATASVDTSYLLKPSQLGKPIEVQKGICIDPRTNAKYILETTFCIAKTNDLGNLKIPGLIPLTSLDCALNYEEENIGKEFSFTIPRNIPSHKIPQLHKFPQVTEPDQDSGKQPTIKLHLNLKMIREAVKKKNLIRKKVKLVQPLFEYFVNEECLICGDFIDKSRESQIRTHMFTHIKLGTYACQSCENKCFSSAAALYSHSIKHPSKKQYSCDICSDKFNRKYFLSNHYKEKHPHFNLKPASPVKQNVATCIVCTLCKVKFNSWKSLVNHKNAHFGNENYMCLFCNKVFNSTCLLRYHTHVRTAAKRHKCKSCFKTFSTRFKLQEHEKIHSKKFQLVCEFCGKKFHFKSNLSEHVQLLHS